MIALVLISLVQTPSVTAVSEQDMFVKTNGNQFWLDGHPYYFLGFNRFAAVWEDDVDFQKGISPTDTETLFKEAEDRGARNFRVWAFGEADAALINPMTGPTGTTLSGGSLSIGTYQYKYSGVNDSGETIGSPESAVITTSATNRSTQLTLPQMPNAYKYNIYRTTVNGASGTEKYLATVRAAVGINAMYTDNTVDTSLGTGVPPSVNTAVDYLPQYGLWAEGARPFQVGPGGWTEQTFEALDRIIVAARKHNIRLTLVLANQHSDYGGAPKYVDWAGYDGKTQDGLQKFVTDSNAKQMYKDYINKLVNRTNTISGVAYKDDPTIFSWELVNELYAAPDYNVARAWYTEMGQYIKSLDANHLVSTGADGFYYANNVNDFWQNADIPVMDYASWHTYPRNSSGIVDGTFEPDLVNPLTPEDFLYQFRKRSRDAVALNKPFVIGELGIIRSDPNRNDWLAQSLNVITNETVFYKLGTNLITNPGFESGTTGWIGSYGGALPGKYSIDNTEKHSANQSIRVTGLTGDFNNLRQNITVKPNTDYVFSVWAKTDGQSTWDIYDINEQSQQILSLNMFAGATYPWGGWQRVTQKLNSGSSTALRIVGSAPTTGHTWWYDDIELRELSTGSNGTVPCGGIQYWDMKSGSEYVSEVESAIKPNEPVQMGIFGTAVGALNPDTDLVAPDVSVTYPAEQATISGVTSIRANASDSTGVSKVEFYIDGELDSTDITAPYEATWHTNYYLNGNHVITAKAYDASGNIGTTTITVNVSSQITSPLMDTSVLVKYKAGTTQAAMDAVVQRLNLVVQKVLGMKSRISVPENMSVAHFISILLNQPEVEYAEPDYKRSKSLEDDTITLAEEGLLSMSDGGIPGLETAGASEGTFMSSAITGTENSARQSLLSPSVANQETPKAVSQDINNITTSSLYTALSLLIVAAVFFLQRILFL